MSNPRIDLTNRQIRNYLVLERAPNRKNLTYWFCRCDCGHEHEVSTSLLLSDGDYNHCRWCKRKNTTHGLRHTKVYKSWADMKNRCLNPNSDRYEDYGGRGITICDEWLQFENFYRDMGDRPEGLTLDRIDNSGNYEPGNCKWSTYSEQRINQRPRSNYGPRRN